MGPSKVWCRSQGMFQSLTGDRHRRIQFNVIKESSSATSVDICRSQLSRRISSREHRNSTNMSRTMIDWFMGQCGSWLSSLSTYAFSIYVSQIQICDWYHHRAGWTAETRWRAWPLKMYECHDAANGSERAKHNPSIRLSKWGPDRRETRGNRVD